MLQHLTISHYALIEHLDIDWHNDFSVITGETGAGKSIILGALNLLLGGRADSKAIQAGHKKCMIEAIFNIERLNLEAFFTANDIDYDATECIIRREVMQNGKSRAFINDMPVPAACLKEIGTALIDIHSQHQNLLIRNELFLIDTLDLMANKPDVVGNYKRLHKLYVEAKNTLKELILQAERGKAEKDYLEFQLTQIDEAQLSPDEQEQLEQEQLLLTHAEDIKEALYAASSVLNADENSVNQILKCASDKLRHIEKNFDNATELAGRLDSVRIELNDIEAEIEQHIEHVEYDPARLAYVEERLNTIYNLEQKHQVNTIQDLLDILQSLRDKLNSIENTDENIQQQTDLVNKLLAERNQAAILLTASRKESAKLIEKEITQSLHVLGMPNVHIEMAISQRNEADSSGADSVLLMFSANKNIPPQDVKQIASGGEIARLMLALKALIAKRKSLPSVVFDEIDTGVSGNMAERMAKVMNQIAQFCQVICITHLPQIAAWGKHHYKVFKEDSCGQTLSHIKPLDSNGRIEEIAHMLSGAELTDAAIENAKSLLANKHP